ncbi:hypothetical protein ScPMuIL_007389 [Solemya velum]
MENEANELETQAHLSTLSDYSDVQPKYYNADYIADIGKQMRIPDRLHAVDGMVAGDRQFERSGLTNMFVPDRIMVAGGGEHFGVKGEMQSLQLQDMPPPDPAYVGLLTPPRVLTLEESFPEVEAFESSIDQSAAQNRSIPNGMAGTTVPYMPGISTHDSLLMNEEDEATLLRTQVAKISRRLLVIEQENQRRSQRELILYPLVISYVLMKMFSWLFRSK